MAKLWQWFRSPSRMALGSLLIIGGIGGIIFWGGFNTFMEHTNSLEFCTGCHEMDIVYEEYSHSIHYENNSGVRAICSDCHVPKPWTAKLIRKIKASNEIYHKLIGSIETPEKFEAKRMELASNVWRSMQQTDSRECRNCHTFDTMTIGTQRNDARFWHPMAIDEGFTCIDCHKGIAHQLPDLDGFVADASMAFNERLQIDSLSQSQLYTVSEKMLYAEADVTTTLLAQITPATKLKVLERGAENWIKVELHGEEALDDASQLFSDRSGGVLAARVNTGLEYAGSEATIDPETRLSWRSARITGWVTDEKLSSDLQVIWDYAKVVYENECARCHAVFSPSVFKAPEWANTIYNMRRFTRLKSGDLDLVSSYLQQHAQKLGDI
jgi:trimethylamine-N-oxide reductase cytochrome c-type subunit TorC